MVQRRQKWQISSDLAVVDRLLFRSSGDGPSPLQIQRQWCLRWPSIDDEKKKSFGCDHSKIPLQSKQARERERRRAIAEEVKVVPEWKQAEEWALVKKAVVDAKRKDRENRKLICAHQYAKEYEAQERELIQLKHEERVLGRRFCFKEGRTEIRGVSLWERIQLRNPWPILRGCITL